MLKKLEIMLEILFDIIYYICMGMATFVFALYIISITLFIIIRVCPGWF